MKSVTIAGSHLKLRLHTAHLPDFWYGKNTDNIYYCTKNQVRGLGVGGDMVILFFGLFHDKMTISPPTHNPRI